MTPDYALAAIKATETLIKYNVSSTPIVALPILKKMPRVIMASFTEIANQYDMTRDAAVVGFGVEHQDAVTLVKEIKGELRYVIIYNQRLPFYMLQRSLARELGHIVLGHDGSKPEAVRETEALVFTRHFICPRPIIQIIEDTGIQITTELLGNLTGCYERCVAALRNTPGVDVPPELNRQVRAQFEPHIRNFLDYQVFALDSSYGAPIDFGTYMDGYKE